MEGGKTLNETQGVTLKALLQNPFLLLPKADEQIRDESKDNDDDKDKDRQKEKEKELELDYDQFSNINPMSAFLGPKLWDDSMLFGDKDLKFEFMDIDDFLNEQGIAASNNTPANTEKGTDETAEADVTATAADVTATAANVTATAADSQLVSPQEVIPMSIVDQLMAPTVAESTPTGPTTSPPSPPRGPASPVAINVDFELTHTDVVLATIPGEDKYDPRSKQFTQEELKPQPMIKKAKKVFVPEEQKDNKYWDRRRKNNVAAQRSREARRVKENQIVLRAAYLEKENGVLKDEVVGLKKDNMSLKMVVERLEKQLKEAMQQ